MGSRPRWRIVALALGLIAAIAIATPVFGLDKSIKKAIKKEVARQISKATGPAGPPGANGSARAYGRVSGQGVVDPARSTPGVTAVRVVEGEYCVTVPGLTPANAVIVPVMQFNDADSLGGDTADEHLGVCPAPNFGVETWNPAGTARDDAAFNFVIP